MVDSKKSTFRFRFRLRLRLRQFGKNKAPCGCGLVTITRRNPLLEFGNALSHLTQRSQYKYTITNHIDLCRISQ